jgi:hypothetical protein
MIKLKNLLFEQQLDAYKEKGFPTFSKWVSGTFPARYVNLLARPGQFPAKSRVAVQQFSEDSIKTMASDWDEWVESTGPKKVERKKARVVASFQKIPGEIIPGEPPEIIKRKIVIDTNSVYKDKQTSDGQPSAALVLTKLKEQMQLIGQDNPPEEGVKLVVGIADYQVYASTSAVTSNPDNTVLVKQRADDMTNAFKSAVAQLQSEMGLYLGDMKELDPTLAPNEGPAWPSKDAAGNDVANTSAAKTAAYGPVGNRNDFYEKTYGKFRKAYITVSINITKTIEGTEEKRGEGSENSNWAFTIAEKPKKVPPPKPPRVPPGIFVSKQKPGTCFSFKDPSKLKRIAPFMAFGKGTRSSEKSFAKQKRNL